MPTEAVPSLWNCRNSEQETFFPQVLQSLLEAQAPEGHPQETQPVETAELQGAIFYAS